MLSCGFWIIFFQVLRNMHSKIFRLKEKITNNYLRSRRFFALLKCLWSVHLHNVKFWWRNEGGPGGGEFMEYPLVVLSHLTWTFIP